MRTPRRGRQVPYLGVGQRGTGGVLQDPAGNAQVLPPKEFRDAIGAGDVFGPDASTPHALARFEDASGKRLDEAPVTPLVEDDGRISHLTDPVNAQDAVTKAYLATHGGGGSGGGEWEVLANGDPVNPALIFAGGDVIMLHIP